MPLKVNDVDALKSYVSGVMNRADHHAENVTSIALALAGAIVWRKDADPIEVMVQDGDTKNVLWVRINGQRYAFSYKHDSQSIELREGSTHGKVLHSFTNETPLSEVESVFRSL